MAKVEISASEIVGLAHAFFSYTASARDPSLRLHSHDIDDRRIEEVNQACAWLAYALADMGLLGWFEEEAKLVEGDLADAMLQRQQEREREKLAAKGEVD